MSYRLRLLEITYLHRYALRYNLGLRTILISMILFDQILALKPNFSKRLYSLCGYVCVLIASKYEEIICISVKSVRYEMFFKRHINTELKSVIRTEQYILQTIGFHINRNLFIDYMPQNIVELLEKDQQLIQEIWILYGSQYWNDQEGLAKLIISFFPQDLVSLPL